MISSTAQVLRDFVSLFYPNYCLACSRALIKGEALICTPCLFDLPETNYHRDPFNHLKRRLEGRFPICHALAYLRFTKNGRIQHLLHNLKYRNQPDLGVALGRSYGQKLAEAGYKDDFDVIMPVPLHPVRLRKRGYNQSAKFAEGLSESLMKPVDEATLFRRTKTSTQTRKDKLRRWENVAEVFGIHHTPALTGRHVLLVDDVVTTGATIEACASALLQSGPSRISIACIAVA